MATGILLIVGLPAPSPTDSGVPPVGYAWQFPVPAGADLVTTAGTFSQTLNLPIGVTAQVFDASTSATYKLSGVWS